MMCRKVPKLRFKGFTDDWKQCNLGDVCNIKMGQSPHSKNYTSDSSKNILVQGNADLFNGFVKPRIYTTEKTKIANKDEIIMTVRAPVGDIAINQFDSVVLGRGVASIEGNDFIYSNLEKANMNNMWGRMISGSTFEAVNSSDIKSLIIHVPSIPEQQNIGKFFSKLDYLTNLYMRKVEHLKKLKRGYFQKVFPKKLETVPKLRFSGFSNDWKTVKLKSLLKIGKSGGTPSTKNKKYYDGEIPFLSIKDVTDSSGVIKTTQKHLTVEGLKNSSAWLVPAGSLTISMYASVGEVAKLGRNISTSQAFFNMIFNEKTTSDFMFYYLKEFYLSGSWNRFINTGTQSNLNATSIKNAIIKIPSIDEQEKIVSLFKNLDELINMNESKILGLKILKKSYLQKILI